MAAVATYVTTLVSTTQATTYNLGNVVIPSTGTVAVVVSVVSSSRATVSSVSLGGTNMTNVDNIGGGGFENMSSFKLDSVSAATLNLTVVLSGDIGSSNPNVTVGVWNVTGNASTVFGHNTSSGSNSVAFNTAASGAAVYWVQGNTTPTSFSTATTRYGPTNTGFIWNMGGDLATSSATPHTETTVGSSIFNFLGLDWQVGATTTTDHPAQGTFTITAETMHSQITEPLQKGTFVLSGKTLSGTITDNLFHGTFTLTAEHFTSQVTSHFARGLFTLTGKTLTDGRNHRDNLHTGFFDIKPGWHSPLPDGGDNVTNHKTTKLLHPDGIDLNGGSRGMSKDANDRANSKWYASLLNGPRDQR